MKSLGYFALFLSVLYMLACQGSGSGGSATPADAGVGLKEKDGKPYLAKPVTANGLTSDIIQGRIFYKQLAAAYGYGKEKILTDSCAPGNDNSENMSFQIGGAFQQQQRQMMMNPYQSQNQGLAYQQPRSLNIEFNFDGSGVLLVRFTDRTGQRTSAPIVPVLGGVISGNPPPQTYFVDAATQTLLIGAFAVSGVPQADYVKEILDSRGLLARRNNNNNSNNSMNNNFQVQRGFRTDYEPGQNPLAPAPQKQTVSTMSGNSSPAISSVFEPMALNLRVAEGINPQHIFQMDVISRNGDLPIRQQSNTLVADPAINPKSCLISTAAQISDLTMTSVKSNN